MSRLLALILLFASCGIDEPDFYAFNSSTSGPNQGLSVVAIWISDSPVDSLDHVLVTIERVELDGIVLAEPTTEINLLDLQNGKRLRLGQRNDVPPGIYQTLRIHLAATGHRVVYGPTTKTLQALRTVIEIRGPFRLRPDERLDLQADFNARLSVLEAGGAWRLDPHITLVDTLEASSISGRVTGPRGEPLAFATVSAQQGGQEIASTRTDADGNYAIGALPGSFTYTVVATANGYAPGIEFGVRAGARDQAFALTAAPFGLFTGIAPAGATVAQLERNGVVIALAGVDPASGAFAFPSVPSGAYDLRIGAAVTPVTVR